MMGHCSGERSDLPFTEPGLKESEKNKAGQVFLETERLTRCDEAPVFFLMEPIPWKTGKVGEVLALDSCFGPRHHGPKVEYSDHLGDRAELSIQDITKKTSYHERGESDPRPIATTDDPLDENLKQEFHKRLSEGMVSRPQNERSELSAERRNPGESAVRRTILAIKKKFHSRRPGSGKVARLGMRILVWMRRASQLLFFSLFFFLLLKTSFRGSFAANKGGEIRLPYPVEAFLLVDPFVATMTAFATHTLYLGLMWSLSLLAVTLIFGRVFCGWVCPFGTLHHFFAWLVPSKRGRGGIRVEANKTGRYQNIKYYLMYAFILASIVGSALGGLFDPICISVRALSLGVIPAAQYVADRSFFGVRDVLPRAVQSVPDKTQDFLAATVWQSHQFYFHQTWFVLFLFASILFMNRFIPRFWCRALCPLGAFLGVFSRFSLFGMEKNHAKCTDCNLCLVHCQGADSPQGGVKWRQDECHMCFNCETSCPEDVIKFRFLPDRKSTDVHPDLNRRTWMTASAAGAFAVPAMRIADTMDVNYHSKVIRPPGAVEERAFLERCIRCAECMKVCPNNALHPAFFEAGLEGLWTPILIPRIGYCEHSCVLCGQVCPTGAISKITEKEKQGKGVPPIKIGTAFYDHGRCLPWSMQTPCIVCEEFCPTSPKAIWVEEVEAPLREKAYGEDGAAPAMTVVKLQRPHVDPSLCIGCGACEKVCPVQDQPAVYVTSVGESRSKTNVILLENTKYT